MKVLLISHTCQSRTEGQPKALFLAQAPGVELRVLVPDRWQHYGKLRKAEPPLDGRLTYDVMRVRWPWLPGAQCYLHHYPGLRRTLEEFRPDIIDLWEEPWGLVSAQTCWLRDRYLKSAKIISETEQNIQKVLPPPFEAFRRYVLRRADFLVGRSSEAIEVARKKGFSGRGRVVPNGVDLSIFRKMDPTACRSAALGSESAGDFVVGYAGRFVPEKGLDDLVDAVALCPERVRLVLVGEGRMRAHLEARLGTCGLAGRVTILPARSPAQLAELMNAFDVFVLPSRTTPRWKEQFGRVLIEAQACGTPVIGSNSGAIPEVVGEGGLIVRERDPADLAAAVIRLMNDDAGRRRMGDRGQCQAQLCSWQAVAGQMAEIYAELARRRADR